MSNLMKSKENEGMNKNNKYSVWEQIKKCIKTVRTRLTASFFAVSLQGHACNLT